MKNKLAPLLIIYLLLNINCSSGKIDLRYGKNDVLKIDAIGTEAEMNVLYADKKTAELLASSRIPKVPEIDQNSKLYMVVFISSKSSSISKSINTFISNYDLLQKKYNITGKEKREQVKQASLIFYYIMNNNDNGLQSFLISIKNKNEDNTILLNTLTSISNNLPESDPENKARRQKIDDTIKIINSWSSKS